MAELQPTRGNPRIAELSILPRGIETRAEGQEFYGVAPARGIEVRKFEQPWHKMAAVMFATGKVTKAEVAEACGVTVESVGSLWKNGWFQKTVTELMQAKAGPTVLDLFRAEQVNCLMTLTEIRDNPKNASNTRRAAAVDILDRTMAKKVEVDNTHRSIDPLAEKQALEEKLARAREVSSQQALPEISSEEEKPPLPSDLLPPINSPES